MTLRSFIQLTVLIGVMAMALESGSPQANPSGRQVAINGMRLPLGHIQDVDQLLGYPLPNGRYWHDVHTGSWGHMGGPPLGLMPAGYFQEARTAGHARGDRVDAQGDQQLSISAMIDFDTTPYGSNDISYTNH